MTVTQRRRYSIGDLYDGYDRHNFSPAVCNNRPFVRTTAFQKIRNRIELLRTIIIVAVLASSSSFIPSTVAFTPYTLQHPLFLTTTTSPRRTARFQNLNQQQRRRRQPRWSSSLLAERMNGDDGFNSDRIDDDDDEDNDNEDEEIDWRAFRARLVQNGITTTFSSESSPPTNTNTDGNDDDDGTPSSTKTETRRYAHESTPLVEVGTVLVSIPTTDLNRILTHPEHHRSVVLITSVIRHDWTEEGEEEARGSTYHGILLNRPVLGLGLEGRTMYGGDDRSPIYYNHHTSGNDGDQAEMMEADSGYHCLLHHPSPSSTSGKSSPVPKHKSSWSNHVINHFSTRLVGSLSVTSMDGAQSICRLLHGNGLPSNPPPPFDGTDYDDGLVVHPGDFYTFAGHITWNPGELEHEIMEGGAAAGGGGWLALSVDEVSIIEELDRMWPDASGKEEQKEDAERRRGHGMWRRMLEKIGKNVEEATGFVPAGQIGFYDHMLEIWTEENLGYRYDNVGGIVSPSLKPGQQRILGMGSVVEEEPIDSKIGPGTVVRATDGITSDFLLYDQEFVRSVVLVLEETDEATVGVLLDHASSMPIDYSDDMTSFSLPLRYGGPMDLANVCDISDCAMDDIEYDSDSDSFNYQEDEGEEDNSSQTLLWLHNSSTLASLGPEDGGGSPVGTSGIYVLSEEEAVAALRSGILRAEETKVFCGVCVWEKVPSAEGYGDNWLEAGRSRRYCGGLVEQVETFRTMEVVRSCNDDEEGGLGRGIIKSVWDILSRKQGILTEETLDSNIGAAIDAWEACSSGINIVGKVVDGVDSHRDGLPEAILKAWVGVNLLGDRLGTFVEVKSEAFRRRRDFWG